MRVMVLWTYLGRSADDHEGFDLDGGHIVVGSNFESNLVRSIDALLTTQQWFSKAKSQWTVNFERTWLPAL